MTMLTYRTESSEQSSFTFQLVSISRFFLSIFVTTLIISLGLFLSTEISGYHLANFYSPVDRDSCTCDCWDGFFRGIYGRGGYKTFYFNYEKQMAVILGIVILYSELLRRLLVSLSPLLILVFIPSIYSNFYGVWSIINYLNDHDYDRMLKSQLFFSTTELIGTFLLFQCVTRKSINQIASFWISLLLSISFLHILLASNELNIDQMQRNIPLILSDLISLSWICVTWFRNPRLRPNKRTSFIWFIITLVLWLFYHQFCPFRE